MIMLRTTSLPLSISESIQSNFTFARNRKCLFLSGEEVKLIVKCETRIRREGRIESSKFDCFRLFADSLPLLSFISLALSLEGITAITLLFLIILRRLCSTSVPLLFTILLFFTISLVFPFEHHSSCES